MLTVMLMMILLCYGEARGSVDGRDVVGQWRGRPLSGVEGQLGHCLGRFLPHFHGSSIVVIIVIIIIIVVFIIVVIVIFSHYILLF